MKHPKPVQVDKWKLDALIRLYGDVVDQEWEVYTEALKQRIAELEFEQEEADGSPSSHSGNRAYARQQPRKPAAPENSAARSGYSAPAPGATYGSPSRSR